VWSHATAVRFRGLGCYHTAKGVRATLIRSNTGGQVASRVPHTAKTTPFRCVSASVRPRRKCKHFMIWTFPSLKRTNWTKHANPHNIEIGSHNRLGRRFLATKRSRSTLRPHQALATFPCACMKQPPWPRPCVRMCARTRVWAVAAVAAVAAVVGCCGRCSTGFGCDVPPRDLAYSDRSSGCWRCHGQCARKLNGRV